MEPKPHYHGQPEAARPTIIISPKTQFADLQGANWSTMEPKNTVTHDVVQNARELYAHSGIDFGATLQSVYIVSDQRYTGQAAVKSSVATNIGTVAAAMEWNMHDSHVVYMSGAHLTWALGKNLQEIHRIFEQVEAGERTFPDEETRRRIMGERAGRFKRFNDFRTVMEDTLNQYAQQEGIDSEYQEILRNLLYIGDSKSWSKEKMTAGTRRKIFTSLKSGDIHKAHTLMQDSFEQDRRIYVYHLSKIINDYS